MAEVWEVAAGGYLGERATGDGHGDGVVAIKDGAHVTFSEGGFRDASDGGI